MYINENSTRLTKILRDTKRKQNFIFQITPHKNVDNVFIKDSNILNDNNESYTIKNFKDISEFQCNLHKEEIIKLAETVNNYKGTVIDEKCYPKETFEFGKGVCEIERKFTIRRYQKKFNVQSNNLPSIMENSNRDCSSNCKDSPSNSPTCKEKFSHSLDVGVSKDKVSKIKERKFNLFILTQFLNTNSKFESIKEKSKIYKVNEKYNKKPNLDGTEVFTFKASESKTKLQSTKYKGYLGGGEILEKEIVRDFVSEKNNVKILHKCKKMKYFKQEQPISVCKSGSIINKPLLSKSYQNKLENESRILLLPNKKIKPRNVVSSFFLKSSSNILANKSVFEINIKNSDNNDLNNKCENFLLTSNDFQIIKLKRTNSECLFQIREFLNEFICNTFYDLQKTLMKIHQNLQEAKKKFRILITIKKITIQTEKYLKEFSNFQEENLLMEVNKYFFQYFVENQKHTLKFELNEKFEVILNFIVDFQEKRVVPVETDIKKLSLKFSNLISLISQKKAHSLNYKFFKDILILNHYYTNQNNQLNELYFKNIFLIDRRMGKFFERCHYIHLKIQSIVDSKCGKNFKPKVIIKELKINFKDYEKNQQKMMEKKKEYCKKISNKMITAKF